VVVIQHSNLRKQAVKLKKSSETDPLTGCLNRRGLDKQNEKLTPELRENVALLALDIDKAKEAGRNRVVWTAQAI